MNFSLISELINREIDGKSLDLFSLQYKNIRRIEYKYRQTGNESNLKELLEDFFRYYLMDSYKNDDRLLDVFYMLVKRVDNPLDLFKIVSRTLLLPHNKWDFYLHWSDYRWKDRSCLIIIDSKLPYTIR